MNKPFRIGLIGAGMVSRHHLIARAAIADTARGRLAATHRLPVLGQKPLAPDLHQAIELAAEVKDQTRLMVHENWRFRGYYRDAAAWLREGRIGDVKQAQLTLLTSGVLPGADGLRPALERQAFLRGGKRRPGAGS